MPTAPPVASSIDSRAALARLRQLEVLLRLRRLKLAAACAGPAEDWARLVDLHAAIPMMEAELVTIRAIAVAADPV